MSASVHRRGFTVTALTASIAAMAVRFVFSSCGLRVMHAATEVLATSFKVSGHVQTPMIHIVMHSDSVYCEWHLHQAVAGHGLPTVSLREQGALTGRNARLPSDSEAERC